MPQLESFAPHERRYAEATAREIDLATKARVDAAFERSLQILTEQRPLLERGAAELLARETLSGADLKALLAGAQIPDRSINP
jgi:cell division protease FtsH